MFFNESVYNPLNGFVAITPFNFTAIGGNLATVPLFFKILLFWKHQKCRFIKLSDLSNNDCWYAKEAISFAPSDPQLFSNTIIKSPHLGGVLFTGSTDVFDNILENVYGNIKIIIHIQELSEKLEVKIGILLMKIWMKMI